MGFGIRRRIIGGVVFVLCLSSLGSWAVEDRSRFETKLKNVELCNGADRTLPDPQINGCTALIDAGNAPALFLAIAHNNRGNAYSAKGDYDRAIDYSSAFANRAETYQKKNDFERAAKDYDDAIRLEPNWEAVWNGRCWTRAVLGQLQAALTDCNTALRIKPSDAMSYDSRGLTYLKLNQFDSAIEDYSSALRIEPKMASALYGRGLARLKKGDAAGGNADVAAAKKLEAKIADEFSHYGIR
jgi:tetratricopeptide (TPR) repeat protein